MKSFHMTPDEFRDDLRQALVTSYESDAYNDFVNEISSSPYAFDITVFDVHVQGNRMESDLVGALATIDRHHERYDVVAVQDGSEEESG